MSRYDDADATWSRSKNPVLTLELLDAHLAEHPDDVRALNFAGWLRTSREVPPEVFELGVAQLKRALAQESDDHRMVVNLADALGLRGRAREAVDAVRPWCERHRSAHFAWNSLGWLLGVMLADFEAGVAALTPYRWHADVQLNLARVHQAAGKKEGAEPHYFAALTSFRPHEAWFRLGDIWAARGHGRRALSALRRTYELDADAQYREAVGPGIQVLGDTLLQAGRYFLEATDDARWARRVERPLAPPADVPPSFAQLAERAARFQGDAELEADCRAIIAVCTSLELSPSLSDRSLTAKLRAKGGAAATLAEDFTDAQLVLYDELLEREEPLPPSARPADAWAPVRSALARRDFAQTLTLLEAQRAGDEPDALGALAEALGDRLARAGDLGAAGRAWALAESAFAQFASWATAGGEGLARMVDVERVRAKRVH